ncbi:MAG: metal ABC transporter substrate-binding protein [Lachnospiraceae bacterium]|nr:metal ABC transporter substrate-binding protein [Lachnospiraceae bacterium]
MKRKLGIIFATMLIFSISSYFLVMTFGRKPLVRGEEEKNIVTSFYPVYIITGNLMQGIRGVRVVNLTENHTGCLHDYQLTTKDMLLMETADLLVINGGGMELFIKQAAEKLSGLTVVDSCEGMELLEGKAHDHDHDHGQEEDSFKEQNPKKEDMEEGQDAMFREDTEEMEENGHVWMDMGRYQMQVHTVADGLCAAYPELAGQIRENERIYCGKIAALMQEYTDLKEILSGLLTITFHDAFIYLCDSFGTEVVHGIDLDADSALSAGELAQLADEIRLHGVCYLLAEKETGGLAEQVARETGSTVVYLDPLTSGEDDLDAYLTAMRANLEELRSILP